MTEDKMQLNSDCEIITTRIFNAARETVFAAWEDPSHLKNWWGPAGFTNTFTEFDFRPGGKWSFIMHGSDKGHYENACEFIKIEKPELISWKRFSKPLFRVLATFEEVTNDKTNVIFKMLFDTAEECNKVKGFAVEKNEENFDRLESELLKMT